jgi:hypothetical protein
MYVGKHLSSEHDKSYFGSGTILLKAIEKYGKENFSNKILYEAENIADLNQAEKHFIAKYRQEFHEKMYNIADGGDGGNTISGKSDEEIAAFVEKMTHINRVRCASDDFKQKISAAGKARYSNPAEREKQSKKIRKSWSNQDLRRKQSEMVKEHHANGVYTYDHMCKPCVFELNGVKKEFKSLQELLCFLDSNYGYRPGRRKLKQVMADCKLGIPFSHNHKNRYKNILGMLIYYK